MPGPFASLADFVSYFESSGNPTAVNPTGGTASGLYGFTNPTWARWGSVAGIDLSAYPTAASAPVSVQNTVFAQAIASNGLNDWTCSGCDSRLVSYLGANPSTANLPVLGGGTAVGSTTAGAGSSGSSPAGGISGTANAGGNDGSILNPSTWFSALGNWFAGIAARGGLFLLGLIFIIGAIALLAIKSGISIETSGTVPVPKVP